MTYIFLYACVVSSIWSIYQFGWREALKKILSVIIPSALIILFNLKAGRLLFRTPLIGIISILPTTLLIFRCSLPIVVGINSWIDKKTNDFVDSQGVVDAEVISKEDA